MIEIPLRSGIVNAVLEVSLVLIVCPVWCSALINVVNKNTFHRAKKGHGVRVGEGIPSLFSPAHLLRTRAAGNILLLLGELFITVIIFWLELGINGKTQLLYAMETKYVLNGATFPDVLPNVNVSRLQPIEGHAVQSRSCFRRVRPNTYELYGLAYTSSQNFKRDNYEVFGFNQSICLDPESVQSSVGIRFVTDFDSIIHPYQMNTTRFKVQTLADTFVKGVLEGTCEASLYGQNSFTVLSPPYGRGRIMVTASKLKRDQFMLEFGGVINLDDKRDSNGNQIIKFDSDSSSCAHLTHTHMTRRTFSVNITTMNTELDVTRLARSTMAFRASPYGLRVFNAVDFMVFFFFSGDVDSGHDTQQRIGQFQRMQVNILQGEREVTEVTMQSMILALVVIAGLLVALALNIFIDNHGRDVTSVAWTQGVVRSHFENLGRCWSKTPDICTYWVQLKGGWTAHFGPEGYGDVANASHHIKDQDISGRRRKRRG